MTALVVAALAEEVTHVRGVEVLVTGVGKAVFFGVIVTLIGCYNGLSTEGGTEGLGRATTATVVHVTMGVNVSDFFITKLFLTLFY